MSKRAVLPAESLSADTDAFYRVLNDEPDSSVVLVASAYIDACLGSMLERFFIESSVSSKVLSPTSGVLGSFASRADVSYLLGLISKPIYQDLQILAKVRNQFAHYHLTLDFSKPEVIEICKELSYAASLLRWDREDDHPMFSPEQIADTRTRFVMTAVLVSQRLLVDALGISHREIRKPSRSTL